MPLQALPPPKGAPHWGQFMASDYSVWQFQGLDLPQASGRAILAPEFSVGLTEGGCVCVCSIACIFLLPTPHSVFPKSTLQQTPLCTHFSFSKEPVPTARPRLEPPASLTQHSQCRVDVDHVPDLSGTPVSSYHEDRSTTPGRVSQKL